MPINKKTNLGQIQISDSAIATLTGTAVIECYGVVGMTTQNFIKDGFNDLLKKENYSKGVVIKNKDNIIEIDLYVVVSFGVKISEVCALIQEKVKYTLESALNMDVKEINVHVCEVRA